MTLGEELRRKYALTSLRGNRDAPVLLAINEALEAAADVAEKEHSATVAARIRSLKWTEAGMPAVAVRRSARLSNSA